MWIFLQFIFCFDAFSVIDCFNVFFKNLVGNKPASDLSLLLVIWFACSESKTEWLLEENIISETFCSCTKIIETMLVYEIEAAVIEKHQFLKLMVWLLEEFSVSVWWSQVYSVQFLKRPWKWTATAFTMFCAFLQNKISNLVWRVTFLEE